MVRLADVTDPGYLEGLEQWPLETVRARRDESNEIEIGLSYVRRIVQGRLDIVMAERQSRSEGGAPGDASRLVDQLPSILSEHVHAPGLGRLPTLMAPGRLDPDLELRLEAALPARRLAGLPELADEELEASIERLAEFERTVSGDRRAVFEVLDRLQSEIVRRYRSGEASVDSLLS